MRSLKITIREDLLKKAEDIISRGAYPGIRSVSGLIEFALTDLLVAQPNKPMRNDS